MKKSFLCIIFISFSILGQSQNFNLGFGFGTGATYIVEKIDRSIDINYSLPLLTYVSLLHSPSSSYYDFALRFQYLNTAIGGHNWISGRKIDGQVSSLTSIISLEHLKDDKKINLGYSFGLGYTVENYIENLDYGRQAEIRKFLSLYISALAQAKISQKIFIHLEPTFFWTDPINSLRSSSNWYIAGEDLNCLLQIGINFNLK